MGPPWPAWTSPDPYDDAPAHGTASGDDLAGLAEELRAFGGAVTTVVADVSDEDAVEQAVEPRPATNLGRSRWWPTSPAGSGPGFGLGPLLNVPASEFRRVLDVNVVGTWLVSKACASRMISAGLRWADLQRIEPGG